MSKKINKKKVCEEMAKKEKYHKSCEMALTAGETFYKFIKSQEFSLPKTIMKYLWQTPSNPKGYQKLIQTCKIFFAKNPILIFPALFLYQVEYWKYCSKKDCKCFEGFYCPFVRRINLEKIDSRIWPLCDLCIRNYPFPKTIMPKIYRSDAKQVILLSDINYLKDILLLASSAIDLSLSAGVFGDNGKKLFIEDYIECFPLLQEFSIKWDGINSPPCKNLENLFISLQKRKNFRKFTLGSLPDNFDIEGIFEFIKRLKIQFETIWIFADAMLPEIVERMENIADKIIETEDFDYCLPYIWFYLLKKEKDLKLDKMISKIDDYRSEKLSLKNDKNL